jgi:hypothetical protein
MSVGIEASTLYNFGVLCAAITVTLIIIIIIIFFNISKHVFITGDC